MWQDVKDYVLSCLTCQQTRENLIHRMPPQAREIKEKMAVMAMDIIGPLPRTERGNEYILSMIDLSTRWAEAIPLRTTTSEEIAHTMVGEWITRYGMPVEILTDQGPNTRCRPIGATIIELWVCRQRKH